METTMYTPEQRLHAQSLIGAKVYYFVKESLPYCADATQWAFLPMTGVSWGSTVIQGVSADIKMISDEKGDREECRNLQFLLKNPYYRETENEDREFSGGGIPDVNYTTYKTWAMGYHTLNKWFFLQKEQGLKTMTDTYNFNP